MLGKYKPTREQVKRFLRTIESRIKQRNEFPEEEKHYEPRL